MQRDLDFAQQNVDDALLRSFIEVFPTLSYDYDNVHGRISVPGLDKPLYVEIVLDLKAPDRFRVKAVERHLRAAEDFIRITAGYWPLSGNDNFVRDAEHTVRYVDDPFAPGAPGGLLSDITEFIYSTSPSPIREFATMAAISFLSAHFGRRVLTPTGCGLNHYTALVAPTGFGKDRAVDVLPQLAHAVGSRVVGAQNFASDSALECLLRTEPCQVLPLDELGMFFKASDRFSESHSQAKIKAIIELFSRSAGVWVAKVRAGDAEKNGKIVSQPIHFPTLSLLGATTPSTLYEGLHEDAFKSGLIPRWLVISVEDEPPIKNIEGRPRVPVTLVTQLREALTSLPKGGGSLASVTYADSSMEPAYYTVPWASQEAAEELMTIRAWGRSIARNPERELEAQVVSRVGEIVSKLATIRALSTNPSEPAVTLEDVRWALGIARISHATILRDAARHMSGSDFEALTKHILEHVRKAGPDGLKRSLLLRKPGVSKAKTTDVASAIGRLVETEQITDIGNQPGAGRKGSRYVTV